MCTICNAYLKIRQVLTNKVGISWSIGVKRKRWSTRIHANHSKVKLDGTGQTKIKYKNFRNLNNRHRDRMGTSKPKFHTKCTCKSFKDETIQANVD